MSTYLDTSALAKLYHQEAGSAFVEAILATKQPVFVSRLGVVEMHSALSGKVRTKTLTQTHSDLARQRFRSDVRKRRFQIIALRARHYELADTLIATHGSASALRMLDCGLLISMEFARPPKRSLGRCEKNGIAARIDRLKPILPLQKHDLPWWGRRFRLPI